MIGFRSLKMRSRWTEVTIHYLKFLVAALTVLIGVFFFAAPTEAARFWGKRQLDKVAHGAMFRRLYRVTGMMLCVAGLLFALEEYLYPCCENF